MVSSSLVFATILTAPTVLTVWDTHAFSPCHHRVAGLPRSSIITAQFDLGHTGFVRDVSLQMGIRSFIKRKILRRDGDKDDADDSKKDNPKEIDLRTVLLSPNSSGLMESPLSSYTADDDSNLPATEKDDARTSGRKRNKAADDVLTQDMKQRLQENAKNRIQRVQAGDMTEEEKLSFLNTALTRTLPPKKPRGPPIRQKIPGLEDEDSGAGSKITKGSSSSSSKGGSSKTDNLWSAITGKSSSKVSSGGKYDYVPVSSLILNGKLRDEEAKRQWIDSITSPDRFASFSAIQRDSAQLEESSLDEPSSETSNEGNSTGNIVGETSVDGIEDDSLSEQDFTQMKRKMMEDQEILLKKPKVEKPGEKSVREALESILAMTGNKNTSTSNSKDSKGNDLAARLEKAAVEQETRDAENRVAAEKKRAEEKQALMEAQKEREAKYLQQEEKRMEEARKKAEQVRLDAEAKKEAERAKVEAAIAKQEEYWENQLKKQQAKREASMSVQEKRAMELRAREADEMFERDIAKDVKRERIREEERMREPEHEGEILKEASDK